MDNQNDRTERAWGARINTDRFGNQGGYPSWANQAQCEKWGEQGLILWDHRVQQITKLSATQSLQILEYLRADDGWKQQGIIVGEPATRLVLDDPEREPEDVLIDQIGLRVSRVQELLELLEANEADLREIAEAEENERGRLLGKVYAHIIEIGRRNKEKVRDSGDENPDEQGQNA
jgi:hypothetical protein